MTQLMPENVPEEDFTTITDINSIYDLFNEDKISLSELDRLKNKYYEWYYSPEQRTTVLRFYRQPDGTMTIHKQVYVQTYGESGIPDAGKFDSVELGIHCAKCGHSIIRGAVPYKKIGDNYYHEWCLEEDPGPKFVMYHATPASNAQNILQHGILPSVVPHQESPWAPAMPVVYMSDSIGVVKDYAEQAWEYYRMEGAKWAIFKIEYDEFPEELYSDLLWGVPGTYYVTVAIPPDHIKLVEYFDAAVGEQKDG